MCFSAEVSFAAGAALLPAGAYCVQAAVRKDLRYLPLALVPLGFGVQQMGEGFVWLGVARQDETLVRQASVFFLFFAIAFWPLWIPLSLFVPERRCWHRRLLALFVVLSGVWLWLYVPLALDPQRYLRTETVHHSIHYELDGLPVLQQLPLPPLAWQVVYLVAICVPLALGRLDRTGRRFRGLVGGGLLALLFGVSYFVYAHAFTSVWCFFAALLSGLLCLAFYRLPARAAEPASQPLGVSAAPSALGSTPH
jgi:hypothetical protein